MDRRVISKLYEVDPQFRDVYDRLYGVAKNLDGADVHIDSAGASNKKRKGVAAGLVVGSAAEGIAATRSIQRAREPSVPKITHLGNKGFKLKATHVAHSKAGRIGEAALQVGNLAVGLTAAHELVKKPKPAVTTVAKAFSLKPINARDAMPKQPSLRTRRPGTSLIGKKGIYRNVRDVTRNAAEASSNANKASADAAEMTAKVKKLIPKPRHAVALGVGAIAATGAANYGATYEGSKRGTTAALHPKAPKPVVKRLSVPVLISKIDEDKRQVFGWASVSTFKGETVRDRQGDINEIEEIEKSAYLYVLESRIGGDMHSRILKSAPKHTSDLIESMVFTDEKVKAMGLPDDFPRGWWVGMQVNDEQNWQDIKTGKRTGFSVHGTGRREEVLV